MLRNTTQHWGLVSKTLHWVLAALIALQIALGTAAVAWHLSPTKVDLFVWHKSFGMLTLLLVLARLAWRLNNPTPRLPNSVPSWERRAARTSHILLYLLMFLSPLTGWVINSAANIPANLFWLIPLPAIAAPSESLAVMAKQLHLIFVTSLAFLVVLHISAALRHHLLLRNRILIRMSPFTRNRQ